jgi:hypothetical protein
MVDGAFEQPPNCEVYFVFSYTNIRGIDSFKFMQGAALRRSQRGKI